ncbi:MAG: hypothetical protein CL469_05910 [Acidimicrobiaceae bacterium]|nr:hypothetical protein [Acidimicrobiaceae bacterium]
MKTNLISNKVFLGRMSSVVAITLMALAPSVIKLSEMEIFRLIFWRLLVASFFYLNLYVFTKRKLSFKEVRFSLIGGLVFGVQLILFFSSIRETSVLNAMVIGSLQPIIFLFIATRFFNERPSRSIYYWSFFSLVGTALTIQTGREEGVTSISGDVLAFFGMLLFCLYFVVSKKARTEIDSVPYQFWLTIFALIPVSFAALTFGEGLSPPSGKEWFHVLIISLIPGTGHLLQNFAHGHVSLVLMGLINLLAVAIVPLYAWWLLEEKPGLVQLLGIALVIGTLAMVVSRPTRQLTGIG